MGDLIESYETHLVTIGRAESTIETYIEILRRLDRQLPAGLPSAHADELRDWIYTRVRSKATHALYRATVAGFFGWACDPCDPRLDFNPTPFLHRVQLPRRRARPVQTDLLGDILTRAADPYRIWYLLAAGQGMRCVEIAAMDRDHVDEVSMWVQGKGSHERVVPTHPDVWAAVRQLPAGPVAVSTDGTRANRRQVAARGNFHLQRTLKHAGVTMHRLRHWYGTHVHEAAGGDVLVAQELLGHSSPNTTRIYVDTTGPAKAKAVAALRLPGAAPP